ncbi:Nicotine blue oxidoreductase [Streptomyces lavendulae subsp. lavendulae]|uniref:Nicotine blue oxidoreductase n=1 Tax=Streptomyces lavendulae subsp. lavendulae TaxID=58340 RepID=A0A2K8PBX4_STRLA|nr:nucleotidyltransferase family protein [Streptomyces lavendulae]ATZ23610.1 Nicotine blue oxidoreductase [Streptomyces lavendulae subsp. lavendulae]QUQ53441.1 Nicotine blue oxidoreductase [Streptomyces lavendulae subsp. lavendulae]
MPAEAETEQDPGRGPDGRPDRSTAPLTGAEGPGAAAPVAGLLLAAGGGRRLGGRPKALLPYRGRPLVENAVRVLREAGCDPVHVVLGASADEVRERADLSGCVVVDNPDWAEGMGSSLRVGLASLAGTGAGAALVSLVDQPGIGARAVARVREAYRSPTSLVAASYDGERGHPVLFGADRWPDIAATATGDRGARVHLKEHAAEVMLVECGDVAAPFDIDTPPDLARLA